MRINGKNLSKDKFDIIVIGAGSGGLNIAGFMNSAGFKTLLIDRSDESIGGDCLNFGCVPSKALIHVAREIHNTSEAKKFGLNVSGRVNMAEVIKYIKSKQNVIREHENADYFRRKGIKVELGTAKFISKNEISINDKAYKAKKVVVATGSRPRRLDIEGIERVPLYTNETIFDIKFLPKKLVVIGGGPIGIELGQAFKYLGSEVAVVHEGDSILNKEDPEAARILIRRLKADGVKLYCGYRPERFISSEKLAIKNKKGEEHILQFDAVLASIGRQLNTEGLDLEKAGIEMDGRKIKTDNYLRTTNKNIYLCGDIAGSFQFTHAAELHAGIILRNFFSPLKKKVSYDHLSWVTYTYPEVATFGLNEKELRKRGIKYEALVNNFKEDDRGIVDEYPESILKLYISDNGIMGGTMVAPNAGELFQELVLANTAGIKLKSIFNKIYPYPTAARINKLTIARHFSKKLNSFNKKMLKLLYH